MWIICQDGTAVNSDHIRKIYNCCGIRIDCGTTPNVIVSNRDVSIEQIVRNIMSGEKFMDFREVNDCE